jgi:uncharacterized protein (TIGR02231 family)
MPTPIETEIIAVTVYTDRALVTRRGRIHLSGDETALSVPNLPVSLNSESVRVSGKGTLPVQLQGVTVTHNYAVEPVVARVAELTAAIEQLEAEQRRCEAQLQGLALQTEFIQGISEKTEAAFARGLARKELTLVDTVALLNFMGTQHTNYAHSKEDLHQQQQQLQKRLDALQQELAQVNHPQSKESFQLSVAIAPQGSGEFQLEVTYLVYCASWTPLYDLRVQTEQKCLQLSYFAEITQTTGEDWANVNLTLSTAKPSLGTLPPKLEPWFIDINRPERVAAMTMQARADESVMLGAPAPMARAKMSDLALEEADFEQGLQLEMAEAPVTEISRQGGVVTFQLGAGGNIPSDGNPHKATILSENFPCQFTYITMPHLVSFAYLQAQVTNQPTDAQRPEGVTLLAGKANIFRDETFVGSTTLEHIAPAQTFKLNLGVDEGIQLERELVERQVDRTFIGSNRRITYAYRILVTNLLNHGVTLELNDRIPHSRNEQLKVKLLKITPAVPLGELGRLQWQLALAAKAKAEVYYQCAIEHPSQIQITGLEI